jgi:hypothetical protein
VLTRCRTLMLSALCLSSVAAAEFIPAPGIKLGEGRLHPSFDIEGRFDSLVGFFNRTSAGAPAPAADIVLHARPGVKFDLQNDSTLVAFTGNVEYLFFTGLLSPAARELSRFQAGLGLDLNFNKDGAVEFQIGDQLNRSDRTQNIASGIGINSFFNNAYLAIPIHPGGRALEFTPRGGFSLEFFDPLLPGFAQGCTTNDITCNPALVSQMNYTNINAGLGARWKFFPKTAFVFDSNFDIRAYTNNQTANRGVNMLRLQAGIAGLLTPRISVVLMAGYGGDFSVVNTVIGQAEFGYTASEHSKISLGYIRNTSPVPVYGSLINDRGYLSGRLGLLNDRFTVTGQVNVDSFIFLGANNVSRNDLAVGGSIMPSFGITSWFDIAATYALSTRSSSQNVVTTNYLRHEVSLQLKFHY